MEQKPQELSESPLQTDTTPELKPIVNWIYQESIRFFVGLFFILIISAILSIIAMALPSNPFIDHSDEYFGNFTNALNLIWFGPVLLVGLIASISSKNYAYLLYPLAAFYLAPSLTKIASTLEPLLGNFSHLAVAYAVSYAIIHPISRAFQVRQGTLLQEESKKRVVFQAVLSMVILLPIISVNLMDAQIKSLKLNDEKRTEYDNGKVQLPSTKRVIAGTFDGRLTVFSRVSDQSSIRADSLTSYHDDSYAATTGQFGVYCSRQILSSEKTLTTKNGVRYTEKQSTTNRRTTDIYPKPTGSYNSTHYCFISQDALYHLERGDRYPPDIKDSVPATEIIDAIASAPTLNNSCSLMPNKYCSTKDKSDIESHLLVMQEWSKKYRQEFPWYKSGSDYVNKSAYTEVSRLNIPEWNMSIPLSANLQGLTYSVYTAGNIPEGQSLLSLGIPSTNRTVACRPTADAPGIAQLVRIPIPEQFTPRGAKPYLFALDDGYFYIPQKTNDPSRICTISFDILDELLWAIANARKI